MKILHKEKYRYFVSFRFQEITYENDGYGNTIYNSENIADDAQSIEEMIAEEMSLKGKFKIIVLSITLLKKYSIWERFKRNR